MSKIKAALFDADGVVVLPQMTFSRRYAETQGLDPESLEIFFSGDFGKAITGKADLKDLIIQNNDLWHWEGDPQALLEMWFAAEDHTDINLVDYIKNLRASGMPCYLATNQEKYRTQHLREVMFPNVFDGIIVSCETGFSKREPGFWDATMKQLSQTIPDITPQDVVFFDDNQAYVTSASQAGIRAYMYSGLSQIKAIIG